MKEETSQELQYYDGIEPRPQPQKSRETVVHIDEPLRGIRVLGKYCLKIHFHNFRWCVKKV